MMTTDGLIKHAERCSQIPVRDLAQQEHDRASRYGMRVGPVYANFARQRYDDEAFQALRALGDDAELARCFAALFSGEKVNCTEQRSALHTALRSACGKGEVAASAHRMAQAAQQRMFVLIDEIIGQGITDVVSVGIGGSDLGPRLVCDALASGAAGGVRVHFVSNVDGAEIAATLSTLDPARTAGILISKSFATQETLINGRILQSWLGGSERLYAVSSNVKAAEESFGIAADRILPMWDWVGGRYSLWSAVGFPIALSIGRAAWEALLDGAAMMDAHVLDAPLEANLPVIHGLTAVWNRNAFKLSDHAVLCYDVRLRLLPAYLQQLVMESLGKRVRTDGSAVGVHTVPVWWGGAGTDVQHSFFQALHQGTQVSSADFIGCIAGDDPHVESHQVLLSHLLAQTESLANGVESSDPARSYPGGRPTTTVLLDALTPTSLGALLAMYEHSVYVQACVWGINAFDQFGVELGKVVARDLLPAVKDASVSVSDPITAALLEQMHQQVLEPA